MRLNLPVFKDEDAKDAVTYQSWRWDLIMYQCAGCRDQGSWTLSYPTPLDPCRVILENWYEVLILTLPWMTC